MNLSTALTVVMIRGSDGADAGECAAAVGSAAIHGDGAVRIHYHRTGGMTPGYGGWAVPRERFMTMDGRWMRAPGQGRRL